MTDIATQEDVLSVIAPPQKHYVCNERFMHILKMLEPYKARGLEIICDDCSVTLKKGIYSECFNVTVPDRYVVAAAHSVITS